MIQQKPHKSNLRTWIWGLPLLIILGVFLGSWHHVATFFVGREALHFHCTTQGSASAAGPDGSNSQPKRPGIPIPNHRRIKHFSLASSTETAQFGQIELIDVGDDTPNLAEFVAHQAAAAYENKQVCLLVTMLPECPGCASLGYAIAKNTLGSALGKVRIVRLDLDEFEEELRSLHLPIDRVPGFIRLDQFGKAVDFLDAGEWNTNDPAEFAPIIAAFVHGLLTKRRHPWLRNPESSAVDL